MKFVPTTLALCVACLVATLALAGVGRAQLIHEPPLTQHQVKRGKNKQNNLEWMWQYGPPPTGGREHDLIQDPNFDAFLHEYFNTPQSFWGPQNGNPKDPNHKSLATTVYDFLTVPDEVISEDNRYLSVTGCVFHFCPSRGLVYADLDAKNPLVVFAAINWIKESRTPSDADAEYTMWIFPNQKTGSTQYPESLPPPLIHAIARWARKPLAGSGIVQKIRYAILVDPDGTPHQINVPTETIK
jgi:hypothetical protein